MERKKKGNIFRQERARIFKDERIDTYRQKQKYKEPTRCPRCNALFVDGRWSWKDTSEETHRALCPACKRIEDNYPAGFVDLSGAFFEEHRKEIMNLIQNIRKTEKQEHPLERIMSIKQENGKTIIATTGIHLPRRLGDALQHAYEGELDISYDAENYVRISWHR